MITSNLLKNILHDKFNERNILILGFGKEGKSTARFLSENNIRCNLAIADANAAVANDPLATELSADIISGPAYLENLQRFDFIIKSPGISLKDIEDKINPDRITCQTDLFLSAYGNQTIGITGTKGKSTTSSLTYHILNKAGKNVIFGGNIGIPLFDLVEKITDSTIIVSELSSHQLEYSRHAPKVAVLLNLYQEHLDHYTSYLAYQKAKYNIALFQSTSDYFIYPCNEPLVHSLIAANPPSGIRIPFAYGNCDQPGAILERNGHISLMLQNNEHILLPVDFNSHLYGAHNRANAIVASVAAYLFGAKQHIIAEALNDFKPLEHRLELVGTYQDKAFFNDSISTIPEAAIAAVESLKPVDVIILGGHDRGIDYGKLKDFMQKALVRNVITTGPAGLRIFQLLEEMIEIDELFYFQKFDEAVHKAIELTPVNGKCLLSPAASSYNEFINFEHRGNRFKQLIRDYFER